MAVPRRSGTSGVSSRATRGRSPLTLSFWLVISEASSDICCVSTTGSDTERGMVSECAADISKASISPAVITMLHSSGCKLCHEPVSDHEKMEAMVLAAFAGWAGTVL